MMEDIFFHERGKQILLSLSKGEKYVSEISSEIGATYAHTFNLIKTMKRHGIVTANKQGRTKYVKLTKKGTELATALTQFLDVINAPASKFRRRGKPRTKPKKKTMAKKTAKMTGTATNRKLASYIDGMNSLRKELKGKRKHSNLGKYSRLIGRYKFLVTRQRPRDPYGKSLKAQALGALGELKAMLRIAKG